MHVVGVVARSPPGTSRSCPSCARQLAALGRGDIMIVVGGVIPPQDFDDAAAAGASAIFRPGTVIADAARSTCSSDLERRSAADAATARRIDLDALRAGRASPATGARSAGRSRWSSRPARTTASCAQELLTRLLPHAGGAPPGRHHRRARRRQVARSSTRSARRSPATGHRVAVLAVDPSSSPHGRQHPGRQDADGPPVARSGGVHPALAHGRARSAASRGGRARRS